MVASNNGNNTKIIYTEQLNEWIKNLKSKKSFKKRISRGNDLRSLAIIQYSLLKNQTILKMKQKERSEKWLKLKREMLEESLKKCDNNNEFKSSDEDRDYNIEDFEREHKRNEMRSIWKEELSDIDSFMNNLDSIKTTLVR